MPPPVMKRSVRISSCAGSPASRSARFRRRRSAKRAPLVSLITPPCVGGLFPNFLHTRYHLPPCPSKARSYSRTRDTLKEQILLISKLTAVGSQHKDGPCGILSTEYVDKVVDK